MIKEYWTPFCSKGQLHNLYEEALDLVREIAKLHGYAVGVHGSETRDLDLIAVPWVDQCSSPQALAEDIAEKLKWLLHDEVNEKPHGRIAFTIFGDYKQHIDLSVMPIRIK